TQDANLAYVARRLTEQGLQLAEVRVVADVEAEIVSAVNLCRERYDYVFTTGGIGPTHDDITARAIARAFGIDVERHEGAAALLHDHYGQSINEARLSMADLPKGAALIDNPVSRAPGFSMDNVFVLAGVPRIMQAMLDGILPQLKAGNPVMSRTLNAFIGEGEVAQGLSVVQEAHGDVEIGSYPFFHQGEFGVSLVLRSVDTQALNHAVAETAALLQSLGVVPEEREK
ncbi:MAG: competence/damage-inducible protein A, partial [Rhodospirillaceae bacterium]|nr:competence/damage-inducible protein A [Rhodospirillaceae bacterium]